MTTAWKELKSQPVCELAQKAFGAPQPEKYGEPMRDPELADILDQLEHNVLLLEAFAPGQHVRSGEKENDLTEVIFRFCEGSRYAELDGPPTGEIATGQLQRTVTLHDRALRRIDQLKPAHSKVPEWRKHIQERRDLFAEELSRRSPNRLLPVLLDQFEQDLLELNNCAPAMPLRSEEDENKLTALIVRIREHTHDTGFLTPLSDVISTEQLMRIVDLHSRAAERIGELKPAALALAGVDRQIKERRELFGRLLRQRQPH